jgi:hypothetical protein
MGLVAADVLLSLGCVTTRRIWVHARRMTRVCPPATAARAVRRERAPPPPRPAPRPRPRARRARRRGRGGPGSPPSAPPPRQTPYFPAPSLASRPRPLAAGASSSSCLRAARCRTFSRASSITSLDRCVVQGLLNPQPAGSRFYLRAGRPPPRAASWPGGPRARGRPACRPLAPLRAHQAPISTPNPCPFPRPQELTFFSRLSAGELMARTSGDSLTLRSLLSTAFYQARTKAVRAPEGLGFGGLGFSGSP